jgi:di/tripeptidase
MEKFSEAGRILDCASIGPQIEHAHSPDECLFIESAVQFVDWIDAFVKQL